MLSLLRLSPVLLEAIIIGLSTSPSGVVRSRHSSSWLARGKKRLFVVSLNCCKLWVGCEWPEGPATVHDVSVLPVQKREVVCKIMVLLMYMTTSKLNSIKLTVLLPATASSGVAVSRTAS